METADKSPNDRQTETTRLTVGLLVQHAVSQNGGKTPSEEHLQALLYLADWYHALATGNRLTSIRWRRGKQGPWSQEVHDAGARPRQSGDAPQLEPIAAEAFRLAWEQASPSGAASAKNVMAVVGSTVPMQQTAVGEILDIERWANEERRRKGRQFVKNVLPRYGPLLRELAK
jgi:hypothetical protein